MIIRHYAFADGTDNLKFTINSGSQGKSSAENINNVLPYNYASFELDSYNIDNPRPFYKNQRLGFSNDEVSSALGNFPVPVSFSVDIGQAVSFSGISINCSVIIKNIEFVLHKADGTTETKKIEENEKENFFVTNSVNVNKVDITIKKINKPRNFIDIYGVDFGKVFIYDYSKIKNPKMINQVSVLGRELPIDTFNFELVEKPEDVLFDKNQKIEIINDKVDYSFYIDNVEENGNTYKVNCLDCISLLEDTYDGDYYNPETVKNIVNDILQETNLSCEFEENIENIQISGYIPVTTKRNALIYLANATGCKIIKHPGLKFVNFKNYDINFNDSSIFLNSYSKIKGTPAKSVELTSFSYEFVESETGDEEKVYGEFHNVGTYIVYLEKGCMTDDVSIVGLTQENGTVVGNAITVVNKSTNAIKFTVKKPCYVLITQFHFLEPIKEFVIIKEIKNHNLYKNYSTEKIDTFSLMRVVNGNKDYENRADELLKYYSVNEKVKAKVIWENPKLDAYVNIYDVKYAINKITTSFTDVVEIEVEKIVD